MIPIAGVIINKKKWLKCFCCYIFSSLVTCTWENISWNPCHLVSIVDYPTSTLLKLLAWWFTNNYIYQNNLKIFPSTIYPTPPPSTMAFVFSFKRTNWLHALRYLGYWRRDSEIVSNIWIKTKQHYDFKQILIEFLWQRSITLQKKLSCLSQ